MKMNKLGRTDVKVPVICLGTMTWGVQNSEAEAHEQLDYAVKERGINFIDTAEIYPIPPSREKQGLTETYLGNWLAKQSNRDELILATKISPAPGMIGSRPTGSKGALDEASIREAVEGSLKRLQTDYIDLYQIHWPVRQTNFFGVRDYAHGDNGTTEIAETLRALGKMVDEGKIRHIGVSNESAWGVAEYLRVSHEENLPRIATNQTQYSLINRNYEVGLAEFAAREDVGLLAYSALNMGILTGKYLDGAKPEGARFTLFERNAARYNPSTEHGQEVIRRYVELAKDHGLDPATLALAFSNTREFTTSTIIGATSMEQLKLAIDSEAVSLNPEIQAEIANIHSEFPNITA